MITVSLRTRLTLWYTLALLAVLCLFGVNVLWQQGRIGLGRVDRELDGLVATLANVVVDELKEEKNPKSAAEEARDTVTAPGRALAILDGRGQALAARWSGLDPGAVEPAGLAGPRVWTVRTTSGDWRVHALPQRFAATSLLLIVASPLSDVLRERREVQEAMIVGIPIVLLIAGAGGFWLAAVGLRPITDMARRASAIPLTGLEDLGPSNRADELGQLAGAYNGLVARLRAALQTQRQFMADASHELRTPVSIVRTAAEVTLGREHRSESEYRESLAIVQGQARRLSRFVEDMLVLARADAGGYPLRPVDLYLDELMSDCLRAVDVLATERHVVIQPLRAADIAFRGDEGLLHQLILNLLQNAVQHTAAGGSVALEIQHDEHAVTIRVTDEGTGIPPADQARIFDRFVQLDPARRGLGTGLGLPIARWIAEAHGGTLVLERSGARGSTFRVSLPRTMSAP